MTQAAGGLQLIQIPQRIIEGNVEIKVLLVDFPDRPGTKPLDHFQQLFFSVSDPPNGQSLTDYYREVSMGHVHLRGTVEDWLRLPRPYTEYVGDNSGRGAYPNNAQAMAEDAIRVARQRGISFGPGLDVLDSGEITALVLIHAGRGAERLDPVQRQGELWSHKWHLPHPTTVGPGLMVSNYMTVPETCRLGVCAHELGHLLFQWQDFYDTNYAADGALWDGTGFWDLMASGCYNGRGNSPAHPAALHKLQHRWVNVIDIQDRQNNLVLPPYRSQDGLVARVRSPRYAPTQYLLLENRRQIGFDAGLPGQGLLVWRVDERMQMNAPAQPGLYLIQADGRGDLENPYDHNEGDDGDPFPGRMQRTRLEDTGPLSTSFPGAPASGVILDRITPHPSGEISLDVFL